MSSVLYGKLQNCITDRAVWEQRQRVWYQMRHDGLRRKRKPFPGAADLHFPLIDSAIDKFKPFYYSQVFSGPRIAEFAALQRQLADATEAAADYVDFHLMHETNFEQELVSVLDTMLLRGRGIIKIYWDAMEQKICFEEKNPLFMIVPKRCVALEDADYFAEVKQLTLGQYKRDKRYNHDPDFVQKIRGGENAGQTGIGDSDQEKLQREGITFSRDSDTIVLWECYQKTEGGWTVSTISPAQPDTAARKPFGVSYKWRGQPMLPYVSLVMEIKDKGWYSPRGIAERLAAFEASVNKQWNEKHDWMSFFNKPLFTSDTPLQNTANIKFSPGEVLPTGIKPAVMPEPPASFDQEMQQTRMVAEQAIMMPDFGVGNQAESAGSNKTATEVDYLRALSSTGVDMKGKLFRGSVADIVRRVWSLVLQFRKEELSFYAAGERRVLPAQALHDNYLIVPGGSADGWNKQQRVQRASVRFQSLKGHPNIDQGELVKDLITADDARLVKRLYVASDTKAAGESKAEALDILLLMNGYPAPALPDEDHATRIKIIMGKIEQLGALGVPVDPVAQKRLHQHLAQHVQFLKQQNPALARQIVAAMQAVDHQAGQQVGGPAGQQGSAVPNITALPSAQEQPQLMAGGA